MGQIKRRRRTPGRLWPRRSSGRSGCLPWCPPGGLCTCTTIQSSDLAPHAAPGRDAMRLKPCAALQGGPGGPEDGKDDTWELLASPYAVRRGEAVNPGRGERSNRARSFLQTRTLRPAPTRRCNRYSTRSMPVTLPIVCLRCWPAARRGARRRPLQFAAMEGACCSRAAAARAPARGCCSSRSSRSHGTAASAGRRPHGRHAPARRASGSRRAASGR